MQIVKGPLGDPTRGEGYVVLDLTQYTGCLEPDQAAKGMNAAIRNAERLVSDAELLLEEERFPSALALAALAIEESGKVSILRAVVLARDSDEAEKVWRNFRWHTQKNRAWILPQLISKGARSLGDLASIFDEESDHAHLLDKGKQLSLYVDCLGDIHWSEPIEVVSESLARGIVQTARILAEGHTITVQEVELWVEYLQPAWKESSEGMRVALAEWYKECSSRGLIPGDPNKMTEFVFPPFDDFG